MAPTVIQFSIRPFIVTHQANVDPSSVGFGAVAEIQMSGASTEQLKVMTEAYFMYKYTAAQLEVSSRPFPVDSAGVEDMWTIFALSHRAMASQALRSSSRDGDQISFELS